MKTPPSHHAELLLAIIFIGIFAVIAFKTWGEFFFIHGLVMAGDPLFFGFLLIVIMMRQHREKRSR